MHDIITFFCIFFSLGGSIYGAESIKPQYTRIVPQDMIVLYYALVEQNIEPDRAAVIVLTAASEVRKSDKKGH